MQNGGIEEEGKVYVEPQSDKGANLSLAVKGDILSHVVADKLDEALKVVKHITQVVSASVEVVLQVL